MVCSLFQEAAKRKSGNRPRGTLITKTMNVKRETSKAILISKVLPAVAHCWPREDSGKPYGYSKAMLPHMLSLMTQTLHCSCPDRPRYMPNEPATQFT